MAKRSVARRWTRRVRRFLLVLVTLAILLASAALFLLGTRAGGRMAISAAQGFLPDNLEIQVGGFSGRLIDRFELHHVRFRIPSLEAEARHVAVSWRARSLLVKRIDVESAILDGVDLAFPEPPPDSMSSEIGTPEDSVREPPAADLPFEIVFDSIGLADISFRTRDSVWISDGRAALAGRLEDYRLSFSGKAAVPGLATAAASLTGTGSTTALHLDALTLETLDGEISGTGDLAWWPGLTWDLSLEADSLRPAPLLPDPAEWPGRLSIVAGTTGRITDSGALEIEAAVDTLFGDVRQKRVNGRFEVRLRDEDIELETALVTWGPASVQVSGIAGRFLDLDFEATIPDLDLMFPGASGSITATGRATGSGSAPRIRATFEADEVALEPVSAAALYGDADIDFAGALEATVVARALSVAGREVDSAAVVLAGLPERHRLEAWVRGPSGELDLAAAGGWTRSNAWSGDLESLRLSAGTVRTWTLAEPVSLAASADAVQWGQACFESRSARICTEGEMSDRVTRASVDIDSLDVARLEPLMPEDATAEAFVTATARVEIVTGGELTGAVDVRTGAGRVGLPVGGEIRTLGFEPARVQATVGADGLAGELDLHVSDSTDARVLDIRGRLESPAVIRSADDWSRLRAQPVSAQLEVTAEDLLLLTAGFLPGWDVSGSFRAVAEVEADADGNLTGRLEAGTDSLVARNTVRGQGWVLSVEPAHMQATVGADGLAGELDLVVDVADLGSLLTASGRFSLPELTSLEVDPETQPIEGRLDVDVTDMSIVEAFLIDFSDASGTFEVHTQVAGTLADATVEGEARLRDGRVRVLGLGLDLTGVQLTATGQHDGSVGIDGEIRSGPGQLTIRGRSERYPSRDAPSLIQVRGERFRVMDIPEVQVEADPTLDVSFDGSTLRLTGEVGIPYGRLGFPDVPPAAVTPSDDVIIVGDTAAVPEPPVPFGSDLTVTLGEDVFFNGFGLAANLEGQLNITTEPGRQPRGRGEVRLVNGTYRALGQELRIDPGRLVFSGAIDDPGVDARAFVRASDGTEAGFRIRGTVRDLDIDTYSVPPKSESDVMAYILFGRPMSQTTGTEGNQASNAAAVLGANMVAMSLAPSLGLDEARIDTGSSRNKAQLVVGKYLSPRLYVGYGIGIYEPISTLRLRYLLSTRWSVETITGDQQSTDLLYRIERGGPKTGASGDGSDAGAEGAAEAPER